MIKKVINISGASKLPLSPAVRADNFIFISGQGGHKDMEGKEAKGIEIQTKVCLEKVKRVLAAAGASMDDVVKATVFLRNAEDFTKMNEIYQGFFPGDKPARSTVITGLVLPEMLVEIECIAYRQS
ncbi:RidA family protein [Chloroflexota bacterium]